MIGQTSQDRVARYLKRGDETRRKASILPDGKTRTVLLDVAAMWERMADFEMKSAPRTSTEDNVFQERSPVINRGNHMSSSELAWHLQCAPRGVEYVGPEDGP